MVSPPPESHRRRHHRHHRLPEVTHVVGRIEIWTPIQNHSIQHLNWVRWTVQCVSFSRLTGCSLCERWKAAACFIYFHTRSKPMFRMLLPITKSGLPCKHGERGNIAHRHIHIFTCKPTSLGKSSFYPVGWTIDGRSFPQWLWSALGCGRAKPARVLPQNFRPKLDTHMWRSTRASMSLPLLF